jgi:hypothetical protein
VDTFSMGGRRLRKILCDVCGKEIPDTAEMEHNESTKHYSGRFWYGNGVMLVFYADLCDGCSLRIKEVIEQMKESLP